MTAVVDASVFVASAADAERHYALADRILRVVLPRNLSLPVPATFVTEVAAAFARKVAAREIDAEAARAAVAAVASPRFRLVPIDEALARRGAAVATRLRVRGYDAIYVAVAAACRVPLVTFDGELADRCRAHLPALRVFDHRQPESELSAMLALDYR